MSGSRTRRHILVTIRVSPCSLRGRVSTSARFLTIAFVRTSHGRRGLLWYNYVREIAVGPVPHEGEARPI